MLPLDGPRGKMGLVLGAALASVVDGEGPEARARSELEEAGGNARDREARGEALTMTTGKTHTLKDEEAKNDTIGFFCSYPVENTRLAMVQVLRNEWGLAPRLARSRDCILQWSPYTRINWNRALEGDLIVSSYFAHAGLSDKARLMQILHKFVAAGKIAQGSFGNDSSEKETYSARDTARETFGDDASERKTCSARLTAQETYGDDVSEKETRSARDTAQGSLGDDTSKEETSSAQDTAREILGDFKVLSNDEVRGAVLADILSASPQRVWVLKASKTNNATEVHFLQGADTDSLVRVLHHLDEEQHDGDRENEMKMSKKRNQLDKRKEAGQDAQDREAASKRPKPVSHPKLGEWLLQGLVDRPLLYRGRKFHMRVNVLALGSLRVFVHRDVVLHVACEPYRHADWSNSFVHVTNHVVQSRHPSYAPAEAQITLSRLEGFLDEARQRRTDAERRIRARIHRAVCAVFEALRCQADKRDFFPMLNAFEVFGFDFIVREDEGFSLQLLEVNHGPALEGHTSMRSSETAWKDSVCFRTVRDVLRVILGDILRPSQLASADHHRGDGSDKNGESDENGAPLSTAFDEVYCAPDARFLSASMAARLSSSPRSR